MTTREAVPSRSHTHHCIICDEEISCHNPNDPQDCLFSAAVCDSCSDEFEDLLPGVEEDEAEEKRESTEEQADDWAPPVDYMLVFERTDPRQPDDEFFDVMLQADRKDGEDWFNDEPLVRTEPVVTKPSKTRKSRINKKPGRGWKKG